MKKTVIIVIIFIIHVSISSAQILIECTDFCSYFGEKSPSEIYGFESDSEAQQALEKIIEQTGLPINFELMAGNVPNAAAVIQCDSITGDCKRHILYNQDFMIRLKQKTKTDWAAMSILAHEIGHHLSGHTILQGGSRPRLELEADKFSGFVLFHLGATLDEAQIAINTFVGNKGSTTHPGRSARIAAITNGWKQGSDLNSEKGQTLEQKTSYNHIQFSGLYRSYYKDELTGDGCTYLKFYKNGDVIGANIHNGCNSKKIFTTLKRGKEHISSGRYEVNQNKITFFTTSKNVTIEYMGKIDGDFLILESKSLYNGYEELRRFKFIDSAKAY